MSIDSLKTLICTLLIIFSISDSSIAQSSHDGSILIVYNGKNIQESLASFASNRNTTYQFEYLGDASNAYRISGINNNQQPEEFYRMEGVTYAQWNYYTKNRIKPNDTRLNEQYHLDIIKAFDAWEITTGGKNASGKEQVIAIVDEGFDIDHEDLKANIWVNQLEIPNDGVDNDDNGYIDDIYGWNAATNTGIIPSKSHGTYVIGALGAVGNNNKGISGINWNTKILLTSVVSSESQVIKAYQYIIDQKRNYDLSNGEVGANIIVTNYSGGINNAFEAQHQIWCNLYNTMGNLGILSIGSTTNDNVNVDNDGDIPSLCSSPYLLIVNSTTKNDIKDPTTGFGSINVDISAPGDRILTTAPSSSQLLYKTETGNSLAAPIVAGAASLLYSAGCQSFDSILHVSPTEAVNSVKYFLMEFGNSLPSLVGTTVSQKRLNIAMAINAFKEQYCGKDIPGELSILNVTYDQENLIIDVDSKNSGSYECIIHNTLGALLFKGSLDINILGTSTINIPIHIEVPGIYFIALQSDKNKASKGFLIAY